MKIPTLDDMLEARERIAPHIHRTPVLTSRMLDEAAGTSLVFKCENLQKVGAFKASALRTRSSASRTSKGVATHSSGNYGTCLSYPCSCDLERFPIV